MHDDTALNRMCQDACGASRPAAVNEDATDRAVQAEIARHTGHFLSRLQSSMSIEERLRRQDDDAQQDRFDAEDAAREEREQQQWRAATGRVRP